jgi:hypothetical protein
MWPAAGIKLGAILPSGASERIEASGIDLDDLNKLADEELVEALADLQVDVNSEDGDVVRPRLLPTCSTLGPAGRTSSR